MILALDLGTKMGYAVGNGKNVLASGMMDFTPRRFDSGGMRFLRFRRFLIEMVQEHGVTEIYFEEVVSHAATIAAHVFGGFLAHLQVFCDETKCPYQGIPVGTLKKFATGKGNAGKPMMIAAAQEKGWMALDNNSDDEADALWVLDYAVRVLKALQ
ncbi:hypothetical protein LCGC14_1770110 [marine sediment metagenome]|uniref:Holliday junction resolvase RuvC n=1 Tax=marine sediment metagenome TaxID=412755 RepID=A0A0F9GYK7_9ZZZZ